MDVLGRKSKLRIITKTLILLSVLFILFLLTNYWYVDWMSKNNIRAHIQKNINHIVSDFEIKNGEWNTQLYYQDTNTPLDEPLYIVNNDGFIIERMNTVEGFLDTAQYDSINSFTSPTNIVSPVNTKWRIYSKPIIRNSKTSGTILTALLDPNERIIQEEENLLRKNAEKIDSLLTIKNEEINTSKLNVKHIDGSIFYSVVDSYNNVLAEDGGPPTYIDRNLVEKYVKNQQEFIVRDSNTNERFLFISNPIKDAEGVSAGAVIHGQSLKQLDEILVNQKGFALISAFTAFIVISILMVMIFAKELQLLLKEKAEELWKESQKQRYLNPSIIKFNKKDSMVLLDSHSCEIEYGSKQYDLCRTLFSAPTKRWEYDQLLEKNNLHEEDVHERTFYDAMIRINNKIMKLLGIKLILYKDKAYTINPLLHSKIARS